ncbi:hypothetical protein ABIB35_001473 [Arthrobacter sp. UYP6]
MKPVVLIPISISHRAGKAAAWSSGYAKSLRFAPFLESLGAIRALSGCGLRRP